MMRWETNYHLLKYANMVAVDLDNQFVQKTVTDEQMATFLKNLSSLGYTLSKEVIDNLYYSRDFTNFCESTITSLKRLVGANVEYKPFYPNFPRQVMETSDAELYLNALLHYLGDYIGKRIIIDFAEEERLPMENEFINLKIIELGEEESDYFSIFLNMMSSKTSLSEDNKKDLAQFLLHFPTVVPDIIPYKETLTFVTKTLLESSNINFLARESLFLLSKHYKTATDVLRLATTLSDGDVSLSKNTKFKGFTRQERKMLLAFLDRCNNIKEDMLKHRNKWIRLGERLHPPDYLHKYPNANAAFEFIRGKDKIATFNSKVESALSLLNLTIKERDKLNYSRDMTDVWNNLLKLLMSRPSELARRVDLLLRLAFKENNREQSDKVVLSFKEVIDKIPTPLLLQLMEYYIWRNKTSDIRVFFPKGIDSKLYKIENKLSPMFDSCDVPIVDAIDTELVKRFGKLEMWNKVYIDPSLKDIMIPFSQRSASESLDILPRGSKIRLSNDKYVRFFIHWKNGKDRTDIDLSAILLDKDFKYVESIAYYNLRHMDVIHSGDITSAPSGAAEFIDVNIEELKKYDIRYVVMSVTSYTNQYYKNIPECYVGWMTRADGQRGAIFEPSTVKNKITLLSESKVTVPLIIDIETMTIIWCDMSVTSKDGLHRINVLNYKSRLCLIAEAMVKMKKANLHDLYRLHAIARASKIVDCPEDADLVITKDTFRFDQIISEFLV